MVKKWATPSFREILVEHCQAFLDSNNLGKDKSRSKLIQQVAEEIQASAKESGEKVPPDLQKVSYQSCPKKEFRKLISHRQSRHGSEMKLRRSLVGRKAI
jgi:hypothetical protein